MRFRLEVSYNEKELVKPFGARFDFRQRYWYYEGETLPEALRGWYRENERDTDTQDRSGAVTERPPAEMPEGAAEGTSAGMPEGTPAEQTGAGASATAARDGYMTVTQVNTMIASAYHEDPAFRSVSVCGEVTNVSTKRDGHYFFSIKDAHSLLKCVMWQSHVRNLKFELQQGKQVGLFGNLEYYTPQGKSQLNVSRAVEIGEGAANLARLQLEARLRAEGLFDQQFKKPIPESPKAVGVVTAKGGQAIQDICAIAGQRDPYVRIILFPTRVQGRYAVPTIVEAIRELDQMGLDTIIVGRGGGSTEELSVYDDEAIVRAVFNANTPIITAVGHQGNWTLVDLAADLRVATPTEAAEKAFPNVMELLRRVKEHDDRMKVQMRACYDRRVLQLGNAQARLEGFRPELVLKGKMQLLDYLCAQMQHSVQGLLQERERTLQVLRVTLGGLSPTVKIREANGKLTQLTQLSWGLLQKCWQDRENRRQLLTERLHGLSPTAKLVDGFGYVSKEGRPVRTVTDVHVSDQVRIRMHDGEIAASVTEVVPLDEQ